MKHLISTYHGLRWTGRSSLIAGALILALPAGPVPALTIIFDYSHDVADGNDFFGGNEAARQALEQAGADISAAITTVLGAITTDPVQGVFGGTTATFDARFSYLNPATGDTVTLDDTLLTADEFRIFVGTQVLSANTLGQGGPGGNGFSFGGGGDPAEWEQAVATGESLFNAQYLRGGPLVSSFAGSATLGATTAEYALTFGPSLGNLWFDVDTNNDTVLDDAATLASFWHFDHTTAVDPAKYDFYSVALHEILHTLGFGITEAWDQFVANTVDWTGQAVIDDTGSGVGILHTDSVHIATGTESLTLAGGVVQEAVMDPNIANGQRKELTTLDMAFLEDMGWSVAAVPEPATVALWLGMAGLAGIAGQRRRAQHRLKRLP